MVTVLRVAALLALAALLLALMLPVTRRSRPLRALRSAVSPWLPPAGGARSRLLARRGLGGAVAVFGLACFALADGAVMGLAGYVLGVAGVLPYGT